MFKDVQDNFNEVMDYNYQAIDKKRRKVNSQNERFFFDQNLNRFSYLIVENVYQNAL